MSIENIELLPFIPEECDYIEAARVKTIGKIWDASLENGIVKAKKVRLTEDHETDYSHAAFYIRY